MAQGADPVSPTTAASRVATSMERAALELLDSLDPAQRAAAHWPFPSDEERLRWYYTPTDHGGLPLGQMRPAQQQLSFKLLAAGLSRAAYVTACMVIGLENVLDELEGWDRDFGRQRGRDPGLYYLRIFGDPGPGRAWSWRFGGHHVSVHHLVVDGAVRASTPLFLGADPASSPLLGGQELRPLGGTEDLGRELVTSLDQEQRRRAIVAPIPPDDLVTGNRARIAPDELPLPLPEVWRGRFRGEAGAVADPLRGRIEESPDVTPEHLDAVRLRTEPTGMPGSELDPPARRVLQDLVTAYIARLPDELAQPRLQQYTDEGLGTLTFAWAGGTEPGAPHYYRIEGPRLLVEYDNVQRGGNHVHSVWRDPEGDFGADILQDHHDRERTGEAP